MMPLFSYTKARQLLLHLALDGLTAPDATHASTDFFTADEIASLCEATKDLSFRAATAVVGNDVHQDMEVCFPAPRIGAFDDCASLLERAVLSWPEATKYLSASFCLNDFAVQKYGARSKGIGIQKDGLRYKYLVFIITLSGTSRLFHTKDRSGNLRHDIADAPGKLVVIKAPDFKGFDAKNRLLHGVDNITDGRLSIGFRYEPISKGT